MIRIWINRSLPMVFFATVAYGFFSLFVTDRVPDNGDPGSFLPNLAPTSYGKTAR